MMATRCGGARHAISAVSSRFVPPRFGARRHLIRQKQGLMQLREDPERGLLSSRMPGFLEHGSDVLGRCSHRRLGSGIELQEVQGRRLLDFTKEVQCYRVVGYASGRQLIDQARLHLDQTILIPGQGFQFGNQRAIGFQSSQISELRSAMFCQQIRINLIGFGPRCRAFAIHCVGVDWIDGKTSFQQGCNQQTNHGFDNARQFCLLLLTADGCQSAGQFVESFGCVHDPKRGEPSSLFVNNSDVVIG